MVIRSDPAAVQAYPASGEANRMCAASAAARVSYQHAAMASFPGPMCYAREGGRGQLGLAVSKSVDSS